MPRSGALRLPPLVARRHAEPAHASSGDQCWGCAAASPFAALRAGGGAGSGGRAWAASPLWAGFVRHQRRSRIALRTRRRASRHRVGATLQAHVLGARPAGLPSAWRRGVATPMRSPLGARSGAVYTVLLCGISPALPALDRCRLRVDTGHRSVACPTMATEVVSALFGLAWPSRPVAGDAGVLAAAIAHVLLLLPAAVDAFVPPVTPTPRARPRCAWMPPTSGPRHSWQHCRIGCESGRAPMPFPLSPPPPPRPATPPAPAPCDWPRLRIPKAPRAAGARSRLRGHAGSRRRGRRRRVVALGVGDSGVRGHYCVSGLLAPGCGVLFLVASEERLSAGEGAESYHRVCYARQLRRMGAQYTPQ